MQRPRPRAATRFGRGRLNVITRRLIQITFRDWRGDINHDSTATITSKYRYRLNLCVPRISSAALVSRVASSVLLP